MMGKLSLSCVPQSAVCDGVLITEGEKKPVSDSKQVLIIALNLGSIESIDL